MPLEQFRFNLPQKLPFLREFEYYSEKLAEITFLKVIKILIVNTISLNTLEFRPIIKTEF
jgi:hypothetical protein